MTSESVNSMEKEMAEEAVKGNSRGDKEDGGKQDDERSEHDTSVDGDGEADQGKQQQRRWPRRDRSPIVLKRGVSGIVKWFSAVKGFGFIHREDNDEEIFVHANSIVRLTRQQLKLSEGQRVEFDVIKGYRGLEAACVSGLGGERVGRICFGPLSPIRRRRSENSEANGEAPKHGDDNGGGATGDKEEAIGEKKEAGDKGGNGDKEEKGGKKSRKNKANKRNPKGGNRRHGTRPANKGAEEGDKAEEGGKKLEGKEKEGKKGGEEKKDEEGKEDEEAKNQKEGEGKKGEEEKKDEDEEGKKGEEEKKEDEGKRDEEEKNQTEGEEKKEDEESKEDGEEKKEEKGKGDQEEGKKQ